MSDFYFVALRTFGREKQRGQSCFKLGQDVNVDILMTLFGSRAIDLTPPQASYRYIHLAVKNAATHQYHLVLHLTDAETMQVEQLCRAYGNTVAVYLWEASGRRWLQFPHTPHANYIDPTSYGALCPKFQPSHSVFLTPSKLEETTEAKSTAITLEQAGNWWWIAGDTYPHKEALKAAGGRWSKSRQQWYFIGDTLPASIQTLVSQSQSPTPAALPPETVMTPPNDPVPASTDSPETHPSEVEYTSEALMRSVRTDDVTAALVAYIYDNERGKPILINFIGSRNAVKQLLSKPFNPAYMGARAESHAFTVIDGPHYSGFRLPDNSYKALTTTLGGRVVEGRIVALDATTSAPRTECYVLVMDRIELPHVGLNEPLEESWLRYIRYRQTPNRPEFAGYVPTVWAFDLYNVYQALRVRIGRPLHERWMPWLFTQVADKPVSSETAGLKGITLCKYIPGYLDPKAKGVMEGGAYRLTCRDLSNLWAEILIRNPNRADGITFGGIK